MSRGVAFTAAEVDLMYGLPLIAQCLFFAIHLRMDYKTGKVGVRPEVSWYALAEALYTEGGPGMRGGSPSVQVVRRAAQWLVKAGLVEMHSNEAQRKLVFFLPLAKRDFFVLNKADSKPTDVADRPLQRGNYPKADRPQRVKADTHPKSDIYNHHHGSALQENAVDKLLVSHSLREYEPQLLNLVRLAPNLNGQAQAALDELAGAAEKGAIRKGVVPYFVGILRKIERGTFSISKLAQNRARSQTGSLEAILSLGGVPTQARASATSARAAMAAIKAKLKESEFR